MTNTVIAADNPAPQTPAAGSADLLGNVDFAVDRDGVHVSDVHLGGLHACSAYLDDLGFSAAATRDVRRGPARDTSSVASALARQAVADRGI